MRPIINFCAFVGLLSSWLVLVPNVTAAEIRVGKTGLCSFSIEGEIVAGDFDRLLKLQNLIVISNGESTSQTIACLNSPGGNLYEGLKIAKFFYEKGVGTYVGEDDQCLSVCAIIFMMGMAQGSEVKFINRTLHINGILGFHRPYISLQDTQEYTSTNINQAFDVGITGVFEIMNIASAPVPWGSGQMIPADLLRVMISTPPEDMYFISTVEDVIRWDILIDGNLPITQPRFQNIFFACENALSSRVRRSSELYNDGLMTEHIFRLQPLRDYSLNELLGKARGTAERSDAIQTGNLRSGYSSVWCQVLPKPTSVGICGIDETLDIQIGNCVGQGDFRYWNQLIYRHPQTQLNTLGFASSQSADAVQFTRCRVISPAGQETDNENCLQQVKFVKREDGSWVHHLFIWPSGSTTLVEIRGDQYQQPPNVRINGQEASLVDGNTERCVINLTSKNKFCTMQ